MLRILLADDHAMVRQGIRNLLEDEPGFEIVGEAADGDEAIRLLADLKPDILVTDLRMPRVDGAAVAEHASRNTPGTGVVVLSMIAEDGYVARAIAAGARGYVLKDAGIDELVEAIHIVACGGSYLSPRLGGAFA